MLVSLRALIKKTCPELPEVAPPLPMPTALPAYSMTYSPLVVTLGKCIYGISGIQEVVNQRQQDRFAAMCDELVYYTVTDEVTASLSQISHDLSSRVLTHAA